MLKRITIIIIGILTLLALSGCYSLSSGTKRTAMLGMGAGAGGAAGYLLAPKGKEAQGAGLGAVAGTVITAMGLGDDSAVRQEGFEEGYMRGQSDAIKRHYFLRQEQERKPLPKEESEGKAVYYTLPGPTMTADGRKLDPHTVSVRVVE